MSTTPVPVRSPLAGTSAASSTITWPQTQNAISVIPQQLLQVSGSLQQVVQTVNGVPQVLLTQSRPSIPINSAASQASSNASMQAPIVQIIQTPSGLVSTSTSTGASVQTHTSTNNSKSASVNSSRSNKQILPKPPGNASTGMFNC